MFVEWVDAKTKKCMRDIYKHGFVTYLLHVQWILIGPEMLLIH